MVQLEWDIGDEARAPYASKLQKKARWAQTKKKGQVGTNDRISVLKS